MSFRNALNWKLKTLNTSNFAIKEIKGGTMISNKQNFEKEAFKVGSMLLKIKIVENLKVKIKLTETKI